MKTASGIQAFHEITAKRLFSLCLAASFFFSGVVFADDVPWRQRAFDLQAANEPLNVFLLRLLTIEGISATMSSTVASGRVNGRFKGRAETVFRELSDTYGLTSYYDGSTLHVYSISEVETRLLQVDPLDVVRIDRTLKQMRLFDARFPLRVSGVEGTVLVSGPPRYVELVAEVVARVADSPTRPKTGTEVRVFRLRHARAADTTVSIGGIETRISGVARTLNELLGDGGSGYGGKLRSLPRTVPGLRGKGMSAIGQDAASAANLGKPAAVGSSSNNLPAGLAAGLSGLPPGGSLPIPLPMPRSSTALVAEVDEGAPSMRGETVVRPDERINAVIVRDRRERMAMYEELVAALDVETSLMEIEATVIDVSDDKAEQLGVDWRFHTKRGDLISSPNNLAGNGSNASASSRSIANDLLFANGPLSAGQGLVGTLLFGNEKSYFLARVNALAERGDANLISRPRILTMDNSEAVLQSTREFFVRVAGKDQVDLFNVSLGLVMRVTPSLVEDEQGRRFKLQIRIEDGNTNSGAQVDQIPVVNRNAIATQAVVGEGQSLLIGGYLIEERKNTRSGVPFLSDVPGLGWLFGQRGNEIKRVERMFLITPRKINLKDVPPAQPVASITSGLLPQRQDTKPEVPEPPRLRPEPQTELRNRITPDSAP